MVVVVRLGVRAHAEGRNRRRDGRSAHGLAGAAHVAGAAQTDRNIKRSNTIVIFINQIRNEIGVMFAIPKPPPGATL